MAPMTDSFERECVDMRARAFSCVAHDLKTPVACIIGSLQIIEYLKGQLPIAQHDALIASALGQAQKLNDLFDTMLGSIEPS